MSKVKLSEYVENFHNEILARGGHPNFIILKEAILKELTDKGIADIEMVAPSLDIIEDLNVVTKRIDRIINPAKVRKQSGFFGSTTVTNAPPTLDFRKDVARFVTECEIDVVNWWNERGIAKSVIHNLESRSYRNTRFETLACLIEWNKLDKADERIANIFTMWLSKCRDNSPAIQKAS